MSEVEVEQAAKKQKTEGAHVVDGQTGTAVAEGAPPSIDSSAATEAAADSAMSAEQAMAAIGKAQYQDKDEAAAVLVVNMLKAHIDNEGVVSFALAAISSFADDTDSTKRVAMEGAGVVALVVESLEKYKSNAEVCALACGAMIPLISMSWADTRNISILAEMHAAVLVVEALKAHHKDNESMLTSKAMQAIRWLCDDADNKALLGTAGVCEAVIEALRFQMEDAETLLEDAVLHGCNAIEYLVAEHKDYAKKFFDLGAMPLLTAIAAKEGIDEEATERARTAKSALAELL